MVKNNEYVNKRRLNQKAEWYLEKLIEKEIKENGKSESKN